MSVISKEIRDSILTYLKKNGKTRSTALIDEVAKIANASPKPCYRELKLLVSSGLIKEYARNRANIEYELTQNEQSLEKWYVDFESRITKLDSLWNDIHGLFSELEQSDRSATIIALLFGLDAIRTEINLFQKTFRTFNKSEKIKMLHNKIDEIKDKTFHLIAHAENKSQQQELFNLIHQNMRYNQEYYLKIINSKIHKID